MVLKHTFFITHKDLAVQNAVILQDVVQHLLVQALGRGLESDFDTARLLWLEVESSLHCLYVGTGPPGVKSLGDGVQYSAFAFTLCTAS